TSARAWGASCSSIRSASRSPTTPRRPNSSAANTAKGTGRSRGWDEDYGHPAVQNGSPLSQRFRHWSRVSLAKTITYDGVIRLGGESMIRQIACAVAVVAIIMTAIGSTRLGADEARRREHVYIKNDTITFRWGATDEDMAVLDDHPDVKTIII